MAQPQAYEREVDFTERDGDDTNHAAINTELDAAALSINQIRDNLALIQRDDGALKNGIVTAESLAPSAFDAVTAEVDAAVVEAQTAATSANIAAVSANTARDQAVAAKDTAVTASNAAALNATTAATKAAEANTSATAAATSATAASNSATGAATSATTATTQATSATNSATAAATSATNAATSASTATTQATNAANSATAAASSATTATTQATNASNAATAAAASLDAFEDLYLGAKSVEPTVDNDGNPLLTGALYFNLVASEMRVYNGSIWAKVGSSVNGTSARFRYIATAGQTTFTGVDSNGNTLAYDAGFVDIYLNGLRLDPTDYTATTNTSIVLATAAKAGDELNIIAFGTFELLNLNAGQVAATDGSSGSLWSTVQGFINWMKGRWDALTSSVGASLVGYLPARTGAVPMTVKSALDEVVSVKRFGATGLGYPNDDRAAIQAALNASQNVYFPEGTYYISAAVVPQSNGTVVGAGRETRILMENGDSIGFDLTNKIGVTVKGFNIACRTLTGTLGGLNGKSAIYLSSSAQCTIEDNAIFNIYNVGIRLYDSSNNKISNNYFGDWFTTATANEDTGNIYLFGASSYNVIEGNFCLGSNAGVGIAIHDYYLVGKQPIGNVVINNRVDNKKAYGIMLYTTNVASPQGFDCRTVISNNVVSDIKGDYVGGASGAGIYLQGGGGAVCTGNTVYDCCKNTSSFGTLAISHITASITNEAQTAPILVADNHVYSLRGPGIWAASSTFSGITVEGNTIHCDQTSGGESNAIVVSNCDNAKVSNNTIQQVSGTAIYCWTSGRTSKRINVTGNHVDTGGTGLVFAVITSGAWENIILADNNVLCGDTGLNAASVTGLQMVGNIIDANLYPLFISNMPKLKASGNRFRARNVSGGVSFIIGGTNTGAVFDATNTFDGAFQDGSTGGVIEFYADAAPPASGSFAVGAKVIKATPVVGQPKGWRCTAAGAPGTWVSEGNL